MDHKMFASLSLLAAVCLVGLAIAQDMPGMRMQPGQAMPGMSMQPAAQPTSRPAGQAMLATDLRNTVCPITGDKVADSNLVEIFDGKVYHLCCADCPKDFEKDPTKVSKAVAADPAKYGVK